MPDGSDLQASVFGDVEPTDDPGGQQPGPGAGEAVLALGHRPLEGLGELLPPALGLGGGRRW